MVYEAGGLVIAPHPLCKLTASIQEKALLEVHGSDRPFHGMETFNPSVAGRVSHSASAAAERGASQLPEFGGSDAHALSMIGMGYTYFPGCAPWTNCGPPLPARTLIAGGRFMNFRDHAVIAAPNHVAQHDRVAGLQGAARGAPQRARVQRHEDLPGLAV